MMMNKIEKEYGVVYLKVTNKLLSGYSSASCIGDLGKTLLGWNGEKENVHRHSPKWDEDTRKHYCCESTIELVDLEQLQSLESTMRNQDG